MTWQDKAACAGKESSIFFPDIPNGDVRGFYWEPARKICATCPVTKECLSFVLPFEEKAGRRDGFWAGMTPKERDQHTRIPMLIPMKK